MINPLNFKNQDLIEYIEVSHFFPKKWNTQKENTLEMSIIEFYMLNNKLVSDIIQDKAFMSFIDKFVGYFEPEYQQKKEQDIQFDRSLFPSVIY